MTTPLHYEYSDVYLREHISRLSRGFVILGLAVTSAAIVAAGLYGLVVTISKLFN